MEDDAAEAVDSNVLDDGEALDDCEEDADVAGATVEDGTEAVSKLDARLLPVEDAAGDVDLDALVAVVFFVEVVAFLTVDTVFVLKEEVDFTTPFEDAAATRRA